MEPSHDLTVRGLEPDLMAAVKQLAAVEGLSMNQAALKMLRQAAGLPQKERRQIGSTLDRFIGTMSDDELREFRAAMTMMEQVDESFWK